MIKSQIIGYLGRDAEIKQINPSLGVVNFAVACDYYNSNKEKATKWVKCVKFFEGTTPPAVSQWLKKGTRVFCDGNIKPGSIYTNKNTGEPEESWDLTISHLELLGSKKDSEPAPQTRTQAEYTQPKQRTTQDVYREATTRPAPENDDLPF